VHSISKAVTLFSLTLKQVGSSLQSTDSVHTLEALDGVYKISQDATVVFDEFNDMLDRLRQRPSGDKAAPSIQQRFQWCFRRHRVLYLLGQLESLKMNASLIQQVLQLGKLMASTSKNDSQEEVQMKQELIRQERAETQNVLIVRYWQMSKMERLWEASRREDEDDKLAATDQHLQHEQDNELALVKSNGEPTSTSSRSSSRDGARQLTIEAPPAEYASSLALVKLSAFSLGDIEQTLHQIKRSPKDMVHVTTEAIEPLLDRWTRWYEVREARHAREAKLRYAPKVDNLQEDDEDGMHPLHRRYNSNTYQDTSSRETSPHGFYLEGQTTDWRKPHSIAARQSYRQRKTAYTRYQPSVSADNSDIDSPANSTGSTSRKRAPRHHVIDSASESEASDHEQHPPSQSRPRRGSQSPTTERAHPVLQQAKSASAASPRVPPVNMNLPPGSNNNMNQHRPAPHHAYSAPYATSHPGPGPGQTQYLPINVANAHNPYAAQQQQPGYQSYPNSYSQPAYSYPQQQQYSQQSAAHARYTPAGAGAAQAPQSRMSVPGAGPGPGSHLYTQPYPLHRPVSRDGPPRSPSRTHNPGRASASTMYEPRSGARDRDRDGDVGERPGTRDRDKDGGGADKKKNAKKNLTEGATKGLLGAGAIAGFLEALEGLSI
jgi:hypothetical protein